MSDETTEVIETPTVESNGEAEPVRKPKQSHKAKAAQAGPKKSSGKSKGGRADVQKIRLREVSLLLKQAADPTRLHILLMLDEGEKNVREITDGIGTFSQPAVSHHIALLRHSRLIFPRREGKSNYYSLTDEGVALAGSLRGLVGV
jgi:DNA-binding transcriptional ArsR family regulator